MYVKCLVLTVCQDHVARAVKDRRDREKLCRLNASAMHVKMAMIYVGQSFRSSL